MSVDTSEIFRDGWGTGLRGILGSKYHDTMQDSKGMRKETHRLQTAAHGNKAARQGSVLETLYHHDEVDVDEASNGEATVPRAPELILVGTKRRLVSEPFFSPVKDNMH